MDDNQRYMLIGAGLVVFAILLGAGSSDSSKRTDGVYESAMSKLDAGQALNEREQQRVADIINWCNLCKGPERNCDH